MKIAPRIDAAAWTGLDLSMPQGPNWESGISILEQRLRGRFTDAVDFLIADDEKRLSTERRFGFAVLGIDCMLVETLEAFRQGLTDTRGKAKELCTTFLTTRAAFKTFFTSSHLAIRFFYEFRCGLVHNAQVFGAGRIWSVGPLLKLDGDRITINRSAFHLALLEEIRLYLEELRDPANSELRRHFRSKMDFIANGKFNE